MHTRKFRLLRPCALLWLASLFCGGCAETLKLNTTPIADWPSHQKLPLRMDLVLNDSTRNYAFKKDSFIYPLGKPIVVNAQAMAENAFSSTIVSDGKSPIPPGIDAILTPQIGLVDRSSTTWAFDPVEMTVDITWTVTDTTGHHVLWVKTVRGSAKYVIGNLFSYHRDAWEHVDLVMKDLFDKSLQSITTARSIGQLASATKARSD